MAAVQHIMDKSIAKCSRMGQRRSRCMPRVVAQAAPTATAAPPKVSASTKVQLAGSDLHVTICCLGTMTWGQQNTEAEAHQQLSYAWDEVGINFMDAAEMYPVPTKQETQGLTEKYIGTWLKGRKRDSVVLASKVCGYSEQSTYIRNPPRTTRVSRDQIIEAVNGSLQRLQTDHLDLLQIHWPDRYVPLFGRKDFDASLVREGVPFEEQLRGLEEVIKAGKVRYVGVSNETSYGVSEFIKAAEQFNLPKIMSIQNGYSLLNRGQFEVNLVETCHYHDVGLLAYSPLAGGALTGKYNVESPDPKARMNLFPGYMERYKKSLVKEAVGEYQKVAAKYGLSLTQLALAWCKSRPFVTSTIIGATSLEQLKEDVGAFSITLSPECMEDIEAVFKKYRDPTLF